MASPAILLLLTMLSPSTQGAKIDFDAKATSIGQLLQRLSLQTGTKLKASPQIAQEIVFVRAKGVGVADLKARIADALAAQWTKDGEIEVLVRTPALEKQIWSSHVAYRRKLVDEALAVAAKRLEQKFDGKSLARDLSVLSPAEEDPAAARRRYVAEQALFAQGPMARLMDRLILACNRSDLAAVGPYERRILKLQPTAMQRGFDHNLYERALAAFATEQQEWIDEAAKVTFQDPRDGRMVSDPRSQLEIRPKLDSVSLEVRRGEMTALLNVNLTSEDTKPFGYSILCQTSLPDPGRKFLDAQLNPRTPAKDDPLVEMSDDSKEFQSRMSEAFQSRQVGPISQRMRDMMLGVVRNDPLSWTVSDVLSTYAEKHNANLVAALPDAALSITMFVARGGALQANSTIRALQDSGTVEFREKDGWLLIDPMDRYEAALDFTRRFAVADLMKSTFAAGRLDIRSYAKYAFESNRLNRGGIGDWFLAMYDRSVLGASDHTDWKSLQLYGSFTALEQRSLEAGDLFAYNALTAQQRKIVERIVYQNRLTRSNNPNDAGSIDRQVEPTDAFALGLPSSCNVGAKTQRTPVIVAYSTGSDGHTRPSRSLDSWNLASVESDVVGNPEKMAQYGVANLAGYAIGADVLVLLKVEVSPGIWVQSAITVPDYDTNAAPVAWDKLPAPWPKQIAASLEQLKRQKAGQPGRVIPPR